MEYRVNKRVFNGDYVKVDVSDAGQRLTTASVVIVGGGSSDSVGSCDIFVNKYWTRGSRAGSSQADNTAVQTNPQVSNGGPSLRYDCDSNPVWTTNKPARDKLCDSKACRSLICAEFKRVRCLHSPEGEAIPTS
ncbi:Disco-interacting protein [Trichinella pseudospiralis]